MQTFLDMLTSPYGYKLALLIVVPMAVLAVGLFFCKGWRK